MCVRAHATLLDAKFAAFEDCVYSEGQVTTERRAFPCFRWCSQVTQDSPFTLAILSHVLLSCDETYYLFLTLGNRSQKKCLKRKAFTFSVSRILSRIFKVLAPDEGISVFSLGAVLVLSSFLGNDYLATL